MPEDAKKNLPKLQQAYDQKINFTIFKSGPVEFAHFKKILADHDGVILDLTKINHEILETNSALKIISRFGVGYENVDLLAIKEKKIKLAITKGASSFAVARHALSLLLALTHHFPQTLNSLRQGKWERIANMDHEDMTVGILGMGSIGKTFAELASALGFKILTLQRYKKAEDQWRFSTVETLEQLVSQSQVLSLHLPLNSQTRGLIDKNLFKLMNQHLIINTARGGIVNEMDLLKALELKNVQAYATDVFEFEPVVGVSQTLAMHPQVLATPHQAASDGVTAQRMLKLAIDNCLYHLEGQHEKVRQYIE
jgi:phosphoglycerate dehydrogenase-like enzyme